MGLVTIKMNRTINCILFLESFTNRTNEDEASSWHPQSVCTVLKSKVNEWLAIPSTYDLQVLSWCCFVNKLPYKCLTPHQHTWHLATLSECQQRKHLLFVLFFKACAVGDLRFQWYRDSIVHLSSTAPLQRYLNTFQDTICCNSLSHRACLTTLLLEHPQTSRKHIKTRCESNLFHSTSSKLSSSPAATASSKMNPLLGHVSTVNSRSV